MKHLMKTLTFFILFGVVSTTFAFGPIKKAIVVSVSSDGHYAISSNKNNGIVLWNLKNKSYKILSRNGNIYSAYFIKKSDSFIWQDLNNIVHVDNINGKELFHFKNFPTYGQVMAPDLKTYFAAKANLDLYRGYSKKQEKIEDGILSFEGTGKLLNLTFSQDNKYLLTSGFSGDALETIPLNKRNGLDNLNGVVLWNTKTGQPIKKLLGNEGMTIATFSPNGKYILSADEGTGSFIWRIKNFKKLHDFHGVYGKLIKVNGHWQWDKRGFPKPPQDFVNGIVYNGVPGIIAIKFIDMKGDFLRFIIRTPYALLYNLKSRTPIKYLPLGKHPLPSVYDYTRDESIDTAPAAHILVTGQRYGNGIIVYKFNPKTKTLTRIWAPKVKTHWYQDL